MAGAAPATGGGKHIAAFATQHVISDPRVACVEAWDGQLLAGCSDGTLLVVKPQQAPAPTAPPTPQPEPAPATGEAAGQPQGQQRQAPEEKQGGETGGSGSAEQSNGSSDDAPKWGVVQALRGFGHKRVIQLVAAPSRSMLLCLADDGLSAYVLPSLRLKAAAARTRGAARFAWDDAAGVLAVSVKRRLLLYKYDGLELVPQREASLPELPHSLAAVGGTTVYAACKREYVAVDVATGVTSPVFAAHTSGGPTALAAAIAAVGSAEVLLTRDSQSLFYGPECRPLRARGAPRGGAGAASAAPGGITWSSPPSAVLAVPPFAVAVVEGGLEVRLLDPLSGAGLSQSISLRGVDLLPPPSSSVATAGGGGLPDVVYFSAAGPEAAWAGVLALVPAPAGEQAEALLALGEHEEALAMCGLMPKKQAEQRRRIEDRVHLAYGQRLFAEGSYEEAMLHLGMSSLAGPIQLLRLFPSLAPPHLLQAAEEAEAGAAAAPAAPATPAAAPQQPEAAVADPRPGTLEFEQAVGILMPYLFSHRSRLAASVASSSPPSRPPSAAGAAQPAAPAAALPGSGGRPAKPVAAQRGSDVERSPSSLLAATAAATAAVAQQKLASSPLAVLVDTALLHALLALPDTGSLLRFVQRPNCVEMGAGEAALRAQGRYSELVSLYQSKGRHSAALSLLQTLSQAPQQLPAPPKGAASELSGLPGAWAAVRYLCQLQPAPLDLLTTHARWILEADPEAGLEMFASLQPPLPPSAVLPILTSYAPRLAASYLEAALVSGAADPAAHEHELAMLYMQRVLGEPAASSPERLQLPEYGKLRQLILRSTHLDFSALLRLLPAGRLLELRAALLERLGQHAEALRILVHRMRRPDLGEAYADRVYQRRQARRRQRRQQQRAARGGGSGAQGAGGGGAGAATARTLQFGEAAMAGGSGSGAAAGPRGGSAGGSAGGGSDSDADIYLLLVQVLLEEEAPGGGYRLAQRPPTDEVWGEVARLLSRKRDAIEPLHALGLLPGEAPLPTALPFLEGGLMGAGERRRAAALTRNLRRAEQVGLLARLAAEKQRSILLTPERACSLCYKRIGSAAFVALPAGLLTHYSCYRKEAAAGGGGGKQH